MCSERVRSACSTSGTHRISLDTDPVISHDYVTWLKWCAYGWDVLYTNNESAGKIGY